MLVIVSSKDGRECKVPVHMQIQHAPLWTSNPYNHKLEATYFSATSHPTAFLARPPFKQPKKETSNILSLHELSVFNILLFFLLYPVTFYSVHTVLAVLSLHDVVTSDTNHQC